MPRTVDSYPEEFTALFIKAYQGEVKFDLLRSQAVTYRQQLHTLRAAMKREGHPVYEQAKQLEVIIRPTQPPAADMDDTCALIIRRRKHGDFAHLIRTKIGGEPSIPAMDLTMPPLMEIMAEEPTEPKTALNYGSLLGDDDEEDEIE